MSKRHVQLAEQLKEKAATFVAGISNQRSLITVTGVELSESHDRVTFNVSIFPEDAEGPALGFLMRKRGDCREYLKKHAPIARIPHVEFAIDKGDKNRQLIDDLLQQ